MGGIRMKNAEAIKRIQDHMETHRIIEGHGLYIYEALDMAIAALREQEERENPKPLTAEELVQLKGEPVWIVWPDCRIANKWWIVDSYDWHLMEFNDYFMMRRYGETWIAYRHKPKEGTK
jgi:hypothetical protein